MPWRLVLAGLTFLIFDLAFGTTAFRLMPDRIDDRRYRTASPLYHHDLRAGFAGWGQWGPLVHRVHINSLGFKDASTRTVPLDSSTPRVLLIGDSFTEGVGFTFERTFAGHIHEGLAAEGLEVLNAGVVSYSPAIYYRKIRYLLEEVDLSLDEVVVFLDISDIEDEADHYRLDGEDRVADRSPEAAERFHVPPRQRTRRGELKRFLREHSLTIRLLDTLRDRASTSPREPTEAAGSIREADEDRGSWTHDDALFERYGRRGLEAAALSMDRLAALLAVHDLPLTLVVHPWVYQIAARDLDSRQVRFWRDWSARRGVQFIDLFPAFIDDREPASVMAEYFVPGDVHLNDAGNRQLAVEFLARFRPASPRGPAEGG